MLEGNFYQEINKLLTKEKNSKRSVILSGRFNAKTESLHHVYKESCYILNGSQYRMYEIKLISKFSLYLYCLTEELLQLFSEIVLRFYSSINIRVSH